MSCRWKQNLFPKRCGRWTKSKRMLLQIYAVSHNYLIAILSYPVIITGNSSHSFYFLFLGEPGPLPYSRSELIWERESYRQPVGFLGDHPPDKATTYTKKRHKHRHQCQQWNSNPRPQCLAVRRYFVSKTARPLWVWISVQKYWG
jgi:hypothetical protein